MNELALFAGIGGGILGSKLLGWSTRCAVEIAASARAVLLARQRDGLLDGFPVWDDIRTFDGTRWRGRIDVISGGFPCQDISPGGARIGIDGQRSGLWSEYARVVREVRPRFVFVENSADLIHRGLGRVLGDLAGLGYDARWGRFTACAVGAPHVRARLFLVAHSRSERPQAGRMETPGRLTAGQEGRQGNAGGCSWWISEPGLERVADGYPRPVDRTRGIGNAQVPAVVALAWRTLTAGLEP